MKKDININVHHLTRVEGHGNILVNITDGTIEKCEWQVPEAPRFFESMVRGRHFSEVGRITSRICGICSVGHTLASVRATEDALGINITEQSRKLRKILKHAENADSHVLHVYFLVAPDLAGAPSVFPLVPTHTEVVKRALRMKRFCHEWGSLIGGRTTHPTKVIPGGMASIPEKEQLETLKNRILEEFVPDCLESLKTVKELAGAIPAFDRPTEYMAVYTPDEYGLYEGNVKTVTPDGDVQIYDVHDYKSCTNEWVSPLSTAKFTRNRLESYMAGALARFNCNYDQLHEQAKSAANELGLKPLCFNPYMNSAAQLVEVFHSVFETLQLIDELLASDYKEEELVKPTRFGTGSACVEVPRGILFHSYTYNEEGMCTKADCIIPTNQNHYNIQKDFDQLVPELLEAGKDEKEMELALEMLVRAYDPCISCSTHYLNVEFKK
ncbi:MAG: nickel-dependent hydrogenase large subunit [Deltaproteobacteria bacterium]|nr:nickel-dependent hydrogenase large subunit [Deltaproteobacteria bacterium]